MVRIVSTFAEQLSFDSLKNIFNTNGSKQEKNCQISVINKVYLLYNRLPLVCHKCNVQIDVI